MNNTADILPLTFIYDPHSNDDDFIKKLFQIISKVVEEVKA